MGRVERYPNGAFCWVDLGTNDAEGAKAFYGGLFGWEFQDLPIGDQGTYSICRLDGRAVAGLYDGAERPAWGSYIRVDDVDRATERARQLGAEVLVEPFDAPGGGRVATIRDPAGAEVSLPLGPMVFEERTVMGSFYGSGQPRQDIPALADLYRAGKLKLDELLTRRYPLERINEAYAALDRGEVARSVIVF